MFFGLTFKMFDIYCKLKAYWECVVIYICLLFFYKVWACLLLSAGRSSQTVLQLGCRGDIVLLYPAGFIWISLLRR